jgi:hypothetical protein
MSMPRKNTHKISRIFQNTLTKNELKRLTNIDDYSESNALKNVLQSHFFTQEVSIITRVPYCGKCSKGNVDGITLENILQNHLFTPEVSIATRATRNFLYYSTRTHGTLWVVRISKAPLKSTESNVKVDIVFVCRIQCGHSKNIDGLYFNSPPPP